MEKMETTKPTDEASLLQAVDLSELKRVVRKAERRKLCGTFTPSGVEKNRKQRRAEAEKQ
jgi:hypothetical protein